jgi:hypothetical protein
VLPELDKKTLLPLGAPLGSGTGRPRVPEPEPISIPPPSAPLESDPTGAPELLPLRQIYTLRTKPDRAKIIEKLGGSEETEAAVTAALRWLGRHQSPDGRWDVDGFMKNHDMDGKRAQGRGSRFRQDIGVTALAALAYLGAGHTHIDTESEYAASLGRALQWMIGGQKEDGDLRQGGQMYGHAMATLALCEAYTMSGDTRLVEPIRRAVDFILKAQNPGLGWRYDPRRDNDTSVLGWQIMALMSAEVAGFRVPERTYAGAGNWLEKVRKGLHGGLYEYQPGRRPSPAMTAEGFFVEQYLNFNRRSSRTRESTEYLLRNLPQWKRSGTNDLYYWYYGTLALHQLGGDAWEEWNRHIRTTLVSAQRTDGPYEGSWDTRTRWGTSGGRVYTTALAALTLEVYYRYLPFYEVRPEEIGRGANRRRR